MHVFDPTWCFRRACPGMYCGVCCTPSVFFRSHAVTSCVSPQSRCVDHPNTQVDDDLAALKGMISGSSAEPPKALPSDPKVDDELQKMKDMLKDK